VFTVIDRGGGLIQVVVDNALNYGINAFLTWTYGGVSGLSNEWVPGTGSRTLQVQLPAGFDATLEIKASKLP
jgi:hypothetical protein